MHRVFIKGANFQSEVRSGETHLTFTVAKTVFMYLWSPRLSLAWRTYHNSILNIIVQYVLGLAQMNVKVGHAGDSTGLCCQAEYSQLVAVFL